MADSDYTVLELQTRIRTIENAWAAGVKSVTFADRSTVYADDYQDRLTYFKGLLLGLTGGRARQSVAVATSGFNR